MGSGVSGSSEGGEVVERDLTIDVYCGCDNNDGEDISFSNVVS